MNGVMVGVIAYVLLQFAIGAWVSRTIFTERDYINAGRQLGLGIASFSVFATWFGAEAIVGTAGTVYSEGIVGATIDPFGYAAALVIVGLTVAVPLWSRGFVTFADLFRERYSPTVERLAILLILPGPIIWGAAQIRAFGQVMGAVSELPLIVGITIATFVVIAYTVLGGLRADALTDFIQAIAVIIGLVILLVIVIDAAGGFSAALSAIEPQRLAYFSADGPGVLARLEKWAIPIFGTMVSVELISRVLGTNSASVARNSCLIGGGLYLLVGLIPVFLGLVGPSLLPALAEPEQIVPSLAEKYLPPVLHVMFAGAVISAILSTVDSVLLSGGSVISHNFIARLRPGMSEAARILAARGCVVLLGLIAFVIALRSTTIHDLVETASAIGSSGLIVVALFGLFTRFGGPEAAIAALVCGAGTWLAGIAFEFTSVPYLVATATGTAAYVGAALAWPRATV
jgi:Na+/proline symporter